jgi:hypothetical protein
MPLADLLRARSERIHRRWVREVLATYPERGRAFLGGTADEFANPVGHGIRESTRALLDLVLAQGDPAGARASLHEILAIRAVQEFPPSRAVAFVPALKAVVRAEISDAPADDRRAEELARLDEQVDALALAAFDVYVECRERVHEVRIAGMRRLGVWAARERGVPQDGAQAPIVPTADATAAADGVPGGRP